MIDNHSHQKRFYILGTFIVAFFLLVAGMRVPDLSRPHRPKPSQRGVIENQVKVSKHIVDNSIDFFALPVNPPQIQTTLLYQTELNFTFSPSAVPTLFPNASRAPPAFLS